MWSDLMAAIIPDKYRKMMPCLTIKIQVIRKVESGYRLPCTTGCPPHVHQLMLDCWKASPNERVPFSVIVKNLDRFIRYLTNIPFLEIFIRDWNGASVYYSLSVRYIMLYMNR